MSHSNPDRGPFVIGVDCSTTAAKAIIVDASGAVLASAASPLQTLSPRPGWHEQDAETWWPATEDAVQQALAHVDRREIRGICLAHQRESFVCVDADNRPLGPAILWLDGRATEQIEAFGTERVERISGKPADITPALYKIAWVRRHRPDQLVRAARVLDTHGFLTRAITGQWVTSVSSADPLALLDVSAGDWSPELLAIAGVRPDQLPSLRRPGEVVGELLPEVADTWGLRRDTVLVAGLGDGQAAGLGAGVLDSTKAYLNLGTAVLLGTERTGYAPSRAYRSLLSVTPGQTTVEAFLSSGTYLPTWYRQQFGRKGLGGAPDSELEEAATRLPPGADGLLALPYWNAAQTPHWDPRASGAVIGWRGTHTAAHFYRSLLEGVAFELREQLEGLEEATNTRIEVLRVMGGGTRSVLWRQIVANVLGRPLERCGQAEVSALGAAVLAQVALGTYADIAVASAAMSSTSETVEPVEAATVAYERFRPVYRELYTSLRPVMHRLDAVTHDQD